MDKENTKKLTECGHIDSMGRCGNIDNAGKNAGGIWGLLGNNWCQIVRDKGKQASCPGFTEKQPDILEGK